MFILRSRVVFPRIEVRHRARLGVKPQSGPQPGETQILPEKVSVSVSGYTERVFFQERSLYSGNESESDLVSVPLDTLVNELAQAERNLADEVKAKVKVVLSPSGRLYLGTFQRPARLKNTDS